MKILCLPGSCVRARAASVSVAPNPVTKQSRSGHQKSQVYKVAQRESGNTSWREKCRLGEADGDGDGDGDRHGDGDGDSKSDSEGEGYKSTNCRGVLNPALAAEKTSYRPHHGESSHRSYTYCPGLSNNIEEMGCSGSRVVDTTEGIEKVDEIPSKPKIEGEAAANVDGKHDDTDTFPSQTAATNDETRSAKEKVYVKGEGESEKTEADTAEVEHDKENDAAENQEIVTADKPMAVEKVSGGDTGTTVPTFSLR